MDSKDISTRWLVVAATTLIAFGAIELYWAKGTFRSSSVSAELPLRRSGLLGESAGSDAGIPAELSRFISAKMAIAGTPGLAAGIIKDGELVWAAGFGAADLQRRVPVTPDTGFILASVSKMPIAVALMQLVEQERLRLDDDINAYLPFPVRNPSFADREITIRMLATHTSSILDANIDDYVSDGDSPVPLRDFMERYLTPGGAYYRPENYAMTAAPGEVAEYSNVAVSLAAYVVEVVEGIPSVIS